MYVSIYLIYLYTYLPIAPLLQHESQLAPARATRALDDARLDIYLSIYPPIYPSIHTHIYIGNHAKYEGKPAGCAPPAAQIAARALYVYI